MPNSQTGLTDAEAIHWGVTFLLLFMGMVLVGFFVIKNAVAQVREAEGHPTAQICISSLQEVLADTRANRDDIARHCRALARRDLGHYEQWLDYERFNRLYAAYNRQQPIAYRDFLNRYMGDPRLRKPPNAAGRRPIP